MRLGAASKAARGAVEETEPPHEHEPVTFDDLYAAEYRAMVALGYTLTGSANEAEDLAQEAFLRLHERWSSVASYDRPGAWLRRVVVNLATSRARRIRTSARAILRLQRQRDYTAEALSPSAVEFWGAVRSLPRRQAQVVALYYEADRPVSDVAAILGCAEGTVRAHLHAARRTLASRLADDEGDEL
jgi:RNA polymerase sigma-70 factor (ECF subfamily)